MHGWGFGTLAGVGVLAVWFVACAGEDIPPIDEELRGNIETVYGDEGGQLGTAGSASAGSGGAAGAAGAAGAGDEPSGGGAAGAGGRPPVVGGGGSGNAGVCDAYNDIIVPSCGIPGCHNAGSSQGAFAIEGDETAITAFIDKPSTRGCPEKFINTTNIDQSLIYTRTTPDFPQECGILQMPLQGDLLTPDQQACLQDWLSQFAQ